MKTPPLNMKTIGAALALGLAIDITTPFHIGDGPNRCIVEQFCGDLYSGNRSSGTPGVKAPDVRAPEVRAPNVGSSDTPRQLGNTAVSCEGSFAGNPVTIKSGDMMSMVVLHNVEITSVDGSDWKTGPTTMQILDYVQPHGPNDPDPRGTIRPGDQFDLPARCVVG